MQYRYTAKIFFGDKEVMNNEGDDVEQLYVWMLAQANGNAGDIHGEIRDNKTQLVIRKFRKTSPE